MAIGVIVMVSIFTMIILTISVLISILLYNSLMKKLNKSSVKLNDFEVVYKFVIPIILSFVVMKYSIDFIINIGFSSKSFIPYALGSIILALFFIIYEISLSFLLKFLNKGN
ncbi:hypothetical protein Metvu_0335 [Methanocaldococcus vulcanius M7]|uniref:Uncharacterized protein n=2 Tax=Methanocaldococcus TaxID=196118 RepID=C9RF50_METVM|nr:hypothetical protein Metvu_0335 [Methanocaldococcus vulcanius M7]